MWCNTGGLITAAHELWTPPACSYVLHIEVRRRVLRLRKVEDSCPTLAQLLAAIQSRELGTEKRMVSYGQRHKPGIHQPVHPSVFFLWPGEGFRTQNHVNSPVGVKGGQTGRLILCLFLFLEWERGTSMRGRCNARQLLGGQVQERHDLARICGH